MKHFSKIRSSGNPARGGLFIARGCSLHSSFCFSPARGPSLSHKPGNRFASAVAAPPVEAPLKKKKKGAGGVCTDYKQATPSGVLNGKIRARRGEDGRALAATRFRVVVSGCNRSRLLALLAALAIVWVCKGQTTQT